jgi:hypothetical protein
MEPEIRYAKTRDGVHIADHDRALPAETRAPAGTPPG